MDGKTQALVREAQRLSRKQLEQLHLALCALLDVDATQSRGGSSRRRTADPDGLSTFTRELLNRLSFLLFSKTAIVPLLSRQKFWPKLRSGLFEIETLWFDTWQVAKKGNRAAETKLGRLSAELLLPRCRRHAEWGWSAVVPVLSYFAAIVDEQLPGYRESGLLGIVIANRVEGGSLTEEQTDVRNQPSKPRRNAQRRRVTRGS